MLGLWVGTKNSLGKWKLVPYTNSTLEQHRSCLSAVQMPSRAKGKALTQLVDGVNAPQDHLTLGGRL